MSGAGRWRDTSLVQLTLVRYREFFREPEAVFWVFVFPLLLAAGLGIAFRHRPAETARIAVVRAAGEGAGAKADAMADALRRSPGLAVETLDEPAADRALRTGNLALVVVPAGAGGVEFRYDAERPDARTARLVADGALQSAAGRRDPLAVRESLVRERGSRYIDFVLPGLLGMNLMGSGIWGVGFSIVDARRKKLLKRLVATPMRRSEYLGSFLMSRLTVLVIEVAALIGFGAAVFDVPLRGSYVALATIVLLSALAFSGIGLLIAARARTIEGASGWMNLVMLPMWVLSGVFFASSNFPAAIQPIIRLLPLTAVNEALRANMLQGAGWGAVVPQLLIIATWLVVTFAVAMKTFRWQ
ncbi:MAG: ABC transporter permease [Gemmatimonadaceae bacterium]